jgi:hypothetical protein
MRIYVVNLGTGNRHWQICKDESVLTLQVSSDLLSFWNARDKSGWQLWSARNETTNLGRPPIEPVTSRWYNLLTVFAETSGDLWVHSDGARLFWTRSSAGDFEKSQISDPFGGKRSYFLLKKPCEPWRSEDGRGRALHWKALHAKSHDFLRTEATFQEISNDRGYRDFVLALIAGESLDRWHSLPEWRNRGGRNGPVRTFDPIEVTIEEAIRRVADTTRNADGREVSATKKVKDLKVTRDELRSALQQIYREQCGFCALTGLRMLLNGEPGSEDFRLSVDRIDSKGHYDIGNLQLVCRFANFWKSATDNSRFKELIAVVRREAY